MLGALLGAFATLGSAAMGASAESEAANTNWKINLLNYYLRERERRDTINQSRRNEQRADKYYKESKEEAARREKETKLGSRDARGNRSRFVEGEGWVQELGDMDRVLQQLYNKEELNQLNRDLPMKRAMMGKNRRRQYAEGRKAQSLLDAMRRVDRKPSSHYEGLLNEASVRGITEGFDSALEDVARASLRTGGASAGKAAAAVGEQRAKALSQAMRENRVRSMGMADDAYAQDTTNLANLYNMFATRASNMPDVSFNPRNIEGMTSAMMENSAGRGAAGGSQFMQALMAGQGNVLNMSGALANAFSKQGGSMVPVEPMYGWANAVGQGGNALASMLENIESGQDADAARKRYKQYTYGDDFEDTDYRDMFRSNSGAW